MGFADTFFPYGHMQVAVGFAAVIWVLGIIKGGNVTEISIVYIPRIPEIQNCTYVIRIAYSTDNETKHYVDLSNETVSSPLARIFGYELSQTQLQSYSGNKKGVFLSGSVAHLYLTRAHGDILRLPDMNAQTFSLLVMTNLFRYTRICLYSTMEDTFFEIFTPNGLVHSDSFMELYTNGTLAALETKCFQSWTIGSDVIIVNSTKAISGIINDDAPSTSDNCDLTWESVPDHRFMGKEFVLLTRNVTQVYITGTGNSTVNLEFDNDTVVEIEILGYQVKQIEVNAQQKVRLTSSSPVQIMCVCWIASINGSLHKNLFSLFPVDYSQCNRIDAADCYDWSCIYVVSSVGSGMVPRLYINSSLVQSAIIVNHTFNLFNVWKVMNISKGIYFIELNPSNGSSIFVFDFYFGRFYQVHPISSSDCLDTSISHFDKQNISTSLDNNTNQTADTFTFFPNASYTNVSKFLSSEHVFIASSTSFNDSLKIMASPTLPIPSLSTITSFTLQSLSTTNYPTTRFTMLSDIYLDSQTANEQISVTKTVNTSADITEIGKISFQTQDNNTNSSVVNNVNPSYHVFLEEVVEDDTEQEYMIAVVLSLCVAIFAVIAVISTFLLLEFISRRKQIRNTKIRPFVS